jgi:hypothetical protein
MLKQFHRCHLDKLALDILLRGSISMDLTPSVYNKNL